MKKVASGFLSLVLAAGLCFSPETVVNVQGAPGSSLAAMEVAQEDREWKNTCLWRRRRCRRR